MEIEDCRWTQMPNDFIDQGGIKLLGSKATCIYWCMARKTKGWQKESDAISHSQLMQLTGFGKATVSGAINKLLEHDLVVAEKEPGKTTIYKLKMSTGSVAEPPRFSSETGTGSVAEPTKETLKETTRKKKEDAPTVHMTEKEYGNLVEKYVKKTTSLMIDKLSAFKGAKGKTYKNDYKAILNWVVDWAKKERYLTDRSGEKEYESELSCEDKMREIFSGR